MADRFVLLGAIIFGLIGIIILKLNFILVPTDWIDTQIDTLLAAIWALFILISYAILVRVGSSSQIEPETVGDNCYYLGFLFTLVSLAVTLFELQSQNDRATEILPVIVSGFGIALASTILGIILRIWFFQQRTDIVARDRENQIEVQKAVKNFRHALSASTASLKRFTTESVQLSIERDTKIRETTDLVLNKQITQVSKLIGNFEDLIKKQQDELLDNSDKFTKVIKNSLSKGISEAIGEINETHIKGTQRLLVDLEHSVQKTVDGFNKLHNNNLDVVTEIQARATGSYKLLDKALNEFEGSVQKMPDLLDTFHKSNLKIISEIKENASTSLNLLDKTNESYQDVDKSLLKLEGSLHKLSDWIDQFNEKNLKVITVVEEKTTVSLRELYKANEQLIASSAENTDKLQKIVTDSIQNYQNKVKEFGDKLELNSDDFEKIIATAFTNGFSRAVEEISPTINIDIKPAITELETSTKKLADTIENINQQMETNSPELEEKKRKGLHGIIERSFIPFRN